jgi:hypothetical protein
MSGVRRRAHIQANLTQKNSRVANCRNFQSRMGLFSVYMDNPMGGRGGKQ